MAVLENNNPTTTVAKYSIVEYEPAQAQPNHGKIDCVELTYFDLLDELPEFSESAILLEDNTIEYCYVKTGDNGRQYFGFDRCYPGMPKYSDIVERHKLINKKEANTFELYPSGKTVLSKRGRILEVRTARQGEIYV